MLVMLAGLLPQRRPASAPAAATLNPKPTLNPEP
jgi:hypothetical protein